MKYYYKSHKPTYNVGTKTPHYFMVSLKKKFKCGLYGVYKMVLQ